MNLRNLAFPAFLCLIAACNDKKITVDIPSTYEGYVYIISVLGSDHNKSFKLDSTGVLFVSNFCTDDITLDLTVDGKSIDPAPSYTEAGIENGIEKGLSYSVSYTTFYFPLRTKKDYSKKQYSISDQITRLNIDVTNLKSCE